MKKAVFHIGYPKTGTSTLQHFLADNFEALKTCGYYYAERVYNKHAGNAEDIYLAGLPGFKSAKLKRIFDADAEKSDGLTLLYSHEVLFSLEADFFSFLAEYFDEVKIIVYLRRQDKWLESYKRWQVAAGEPIDNHKHQAPYCMIDYHKTINRIEKQLGIEAIRIRPFERGQFYQGNINFDLLAALDIQPEKFEMFSHSEGEKNISMNGKALVFKALLNRYLPNRMNRVKNTKKRFGPWRGTFISRELGGFPTEGKDLAFQLMSYQEKMKVLKEVEKGNQAIEARFFSGKAMYSEAMPDKQTISYDDLTEAEIKEMAVFTFKALMEKAGLAGKEYLIASIASVLDAFAEYDRYAKVFKDDWMLVKNSGWFDGKFYFDTNPTLPKETDAVLHYLLFGHKENADPSRKFSTEQYKLDYPDVLTYDICPLVHFLRFGQAEGKQPKASTKPKKKTRIEKTLMKARSKLFN